MIKEILKGQACVYHSKYYIYPDSQEDNIFYLGALFFTLGNIITYYAICMLKIFLDIPPFSNF